MSISDSIAMTTLFIIFLVLFILMIIMEVMLTLHNFSRPNFFYDFRINRVLVPKLVTLNKTVEICDFLIEENKTNSHILTWRPALFISFITSCIATFFVKLFYRDAKLQIFLLNFVIIFVMMTGFMMILNYHCFGEQIRFTNICLEKIKKSEPITF
jgi:hypothetical protein